MATQQPAYRAFTVVKREGQDDYWLPIGAAFPHQNGDGYNVVLQALPIPDGDGVCKIVLRPPKETERTTRILIKTQTTSEPNRPCGKRTTADTVAVADHSRNVQKNPALDAGSRPLSAGRLKSRRQPRRLFMEIIVPSSRRVLAYVPGTAPLPPGSLHGRCPAAARRQDPRRFPAFVARSRGLSVLTPRLAAGRRNVRAGAAAVWLGRALTANSTNTLWKTNPASPNASVHSKARPRRSWKRHSAWKQPRASSASADRKRRTASARHYQHHHHSTMSTLYDTDRSRLPDRSRCAASAAVANSA